MPRLTTCLIRYVLDPAKTAEFEHYGRLWIKLIEKFGGTHYGYFLPGEGPAAEFSFPGVGSTGPTNVAIALFSFPDLAAYERYRHRAAHDDEARAATAYVQETKCFLSYERSFLQPLPPLAEKPRRPERCVVAAARGYSLRA
jgi:hypothetical protein